MSGNAVLFTKKRAVFVVISYSSVLTQVKMDTTRALVWDNKLSTNAITVSPKVNNKEFL